MTKKKEEKSDNVMEESDARGKCSSALFSDAPAAAGEKSDKMPLEIAIYAGGMNSKSHEFLEWCCKKRAEKTKCLVFLATRGGSPSIAYRIARAMQRNFNHITVAIPWICKSAGTLLCLGASSLMIGKRGELGPLDVQIPKKDELAAFSSGLTPLHALKVLKEHSFGYFEEAFLSIIGKSRGQISTNRAARIAIKLTIGLFGEIYSQIDPLQLGKTTRDMDIAYVYGQRLSAVSKNLKRGALNRLISSYPDHGFVIDEEEAKELFNNVESIPEDLESSCEHFLPDIKRAVQDERPFFQVIEGRMETSVCAHSETIKEEKLTDGLL